MSPLSGQVGTQIVATCKSRSHSVLMLPCFYFAVQERENIMSEEKPSIRKEFQEFVSAWRDVRQVTRRARLDGEITPEEKQDIKVQFLEAARETADLLQVSKEKADAIIAFLRENF